MVPPCHPVPRRERQTSLSLQTPLLPLRWQLEGAGRKPEEARGSPVADLLCMMNINLWAILFYFIFKIG